MAGAMPCKSLRRPELRRPVLWLSIDRGENSLVSASNHESIPLQQPYVFAGEGIGDSLRLAFLDAFPPPQVQAPDPQGVSPSGGSVVLYYFRSPPHDANRRGAMSSPPIVLYRVSTAAGYASRGPSRRLTRTIFRCSQPVTTDPFRLGIAPCGGA